MGTIIPIIGTALRGRARGALLASLFGHADESFHVRQLIRAVAAGNGSLQRELIHLTEMGLVLRRNQGNQVLYQANSQSPIFPEIKSLITKTLGVHDVIRSALASLEPQIRQEECASSDLDLMVLGSALFSDVVSALGPAQRTLGREINPTVFPVSEFRAKLPGNHLLRSLMREKKVFILGTEHEFRKLAPKRLVGSPRDKSGGTR